MSGSRIGRFVLIGIFYDSARFLVPIYRGRNGIGICVPYNKKNEMTLNER